jgi:hypothetical protein
VKLTLASRVRCVLERMTFDWSECLGFAAASLSD